MWEIKMAALVIWFFIATIIVYPVYTRADGDERALCICIYVLTSLYAIKKIVE